MQTRHLEAEDAPRVEAFLLEHLESSMFLLHNLLKEGTEFQGRVNQAEYLGAFRDNALVGVAAHTWLNTILLQAPCPDALDTLEAALPRALRRPITGLLGPRDQCLEWMERLAVKRNNATLDLDEPLYRLALPCSVSPDSINVSSRFRKTERADIALLTQWRVAHLFETMHLCMSPELEARAAAEIHSAHLEGRAFLLEEDGQAVAHCLFSAISPAAVQLGGIWTPPGYRRQGFGRTILTRALEFAGKTMGCTLAVVVIDDENRAALSLCESLGFSRCGRYSFTFWDA